MKEYNELVEQRPSCESPNDCKNAGFVCEGGSFMTTYYNNRCGCRNEV